MRGDPLQSRTRSYVLSPKLRVWVWNPTQVIYISDSLGLKKEKRNLRVFFLVFFWSETHTSSFHDFYGDCNIRLFVCWKCIKTERNGEKRRGQGHNWARMSFSQLRSLSHFNTSLWLPLKERIYNVCAEEMLLSCGLFFQFHSEKRSFHY